MCYGYPLPLGVGYGLRLWAIRGACSTGETVSAGVCGQCMGHGEWGRCPSTWECGRARAGWMRAGSGTRGSRGRGVHRFRCGRRRGRSRNT